MLRRIFIVAWKEFLHLRKDTVLVPFLLIGALAELTLIAWATGQPIDNINMTVVDADQTEQSAGLIEQLSATDTLSRKHDVENAEAVYDLMDDNKTTVGVVVPEGYGESMSMTGYLAAAASGDIPIVKLILNGTDALSAWTAEVKAEEIILEEAVRQAFGMEPADYADELPQVNVMYNEDLKRSYYTLPAEMAMMFYMMTVIMAAIAIARERERGTFEQLLVMPYRSWEVIIGKTLTPMIIGYVLFVTMLGLTTVVFGVPLRGSLPLLLVLAVIYLTAEVGKGILLSLAARTQLQAVLMVIGIAMLDMVFSGYAVAVETMPVFLQKVANLFAIRHWLVILRGIMLKEVGLEVLLPHVVAIVIIGAVIIAFTATQYRRALT
jgi:ABC-2 type transport system permease protein